MATVSEMLAARSRVAAPSETVERSRHEVWQEKVAASGLLFWGP
jgi:hypothetical protein